MFAEKLVEIKHHYTLYGCTNSLSSQTFLGPGVHFTIKCTQEILDQSFTKEVGDQTLPPNWPQNIGKNYAQYH